MLLLLLLLSLVLVTWLLGSSSTLDLCDGLAVFLEETQVGCASMSVLAQMKLQAVLVFGGISTILASELYIMKLFLLRMSFNCS